MNVSRGAPNYTYREAVKDFKIYLEFKWFWLGLPRPTPSQFDIADFLQNGGDRQLIEGFRGVAKTWITASFCEWLWLRDRDRRIIIISGAQRKADEISLFIKSSIDNFPLLKPLRWADWEKQHARWGIQQFNVKGSPPDVAPSCKAMSVLGMIVGSRATDIIGDDIETPENSATVESRDKLSGVIGEFENILLPGGNVRLLGTPQSEESIYNQVEERGYNSLYIPIRVPEPDTVGIYKDRLSPTVKELYAKQLFGEPTEPTRFPEEVMIQKEAGMTKSAWRLQMMLDSTLSDAERYPLKLSDLIVTSLEKSSAPLTVVWGGGCGDKHRITDIQNLGFRSDKLCRPQVISSDTDSWKPYERKVLFVDPSGKGTNETGWAVIATLGGRYFVLDMGGHSDGYSTETLQALTDTAREFGVTGVVYEENYGGGMFGEILGQFMRPQYPVAVEGVRSSGQKEQRIIDTLEPVLRSHKLVIDHSCLLRDSLLDNKSYSFQHQLTRVTKDRGCLKFDDRLDVVSIGVKYFIDVAGVNTAENAREAEARHKLEALENMLRASSVFSLSPMGHQLRGRPKGGKQMWRKL